LNGEQGVVLNFNPANGRWVVRLSNGDCKQVKSANLTQHPGSVLGYSESAHGETAGLSCEPQLKPGTLQSWRCKPCACWNAMSTSHCRMCGKKYTFKNRVAQREVGAGGEGDEECDAVGLETTHHIRELPSTDPWQGSTRRYQGSVNRPPPIVLALLLILVYASAAGLSYWVLLPALLQNFDANCQERQQTVRGAERQAAVAVARMFVSPSQSKCSSSECGDVCTWAQLFTCNADGHVGTLHTKNGSLVGSLPDSLGSLAQLTNVSLSSNQLTGSLPDSLGSLAQLTQLDLSCNELTGVLPVLNYSHFTDGCNLRHSYYFSEDFSDFGGPVCQTPIFAHFQRTYFTCPLPPGAAEHCGAECR
jgi:hypothetical protein